MSLRIAPAVAASYAWARGLSIPTASEELLRLLATRRDQGITATGRYRYRNGSDHLDLTINVDESAGVIVGVTVRGYRGRP